MKERLLSGVRVVDLTVAGAGPRGGRLLSMLGADVVKIESEPNGDVILQRPPTQRGIPVGYTMFNKGKRSVGIDLHTRSGRDYAHELVAQADAFITSMRPGAPEHLGLGFDELHRVNPRLVYGRLTAWGSCGEMSEWPGADPLVQFFSGWASIQGALGGRAELGRFVGLIDESTGTALAAGVVQALIKRMRTGTGSHVEVSLLKTALTLQLTHIAEYWAGAEQRPLGSRSGVIAPEEAFRCADGNYLAVGVEDEAQWRGLCAAVDRSDLEADPRFATNRDRLMRIDELARELSDTFQMFPSNWWQIRLSSSGVPNARFYDWENLKYHRQVHDNQLINLVEVQDLGPMYQSGPPWEIQLADDLRNLRTKPGADRDAISGWSAPSAAGRAEQGSESSSASARSSLPLAGFSVLDLTCGICGPLASRLLNDAGADVTKVEPVDGDRARLIGTITDSGMGAVFGTVNRGKQHFAVDLTAPEGMHSLSESLRAADVFMVDAETARRYPQVSCSALWDCDPRLVYNEITNFGRRGPWADKPATELVLQAVTEHWRGLGEPGAPGAPPTRVGADISSAVTALHVALITTAALHHRERSGRGVFASTSRFAALLYARETVWASQGQPDQWDGWAARPFYSPDYGYRASDGIIYLIALRADRGEFARLLTRLGLDEYRTDPRFADGGKNAIGIGRFAAELKEIFEGAFAAWTRDELVALLAEHGIAAVPLYGYGDLFADKRLADLRLLDDTGAKDGAGHHLKSPWEFTEHGPAEAAGTRPASTRAQVQRPVTR